jgi:hypothetical protein
MINRLRAFTTDQAGGRIPLKTTIIKTSATGLILLLSIWSISLLVVLHPLPFIAIGAAVAGAWYGSRFGFALPFRQPPTPQPTADQTPAPRARTAAASQQARRPAIGGNRR